MTVAATAVLGAIAPLADCWHEGSGWHWFLFPFVWILVVAGIIWLVRGAPPWRRRRWAGHRESAVEALERRFAQGDIEADEYQRRRSVLEESKRE